MSDISYPPETDLPYIEEDYYSDEPPGGGRRVLAILVMVLALGALVVLGAQWLQGKAQDALASDQQTTVTVDVPVEFSVPAGASARLIASLLEAEGVIASANDFEAEVRNAGVAERLAAGEYALTTGMTNAQVIAALLEGPAPVEGYRLIVREGLRLGEVIEALANQSAFAAADFELALQSGSVRSPYLTGPANVLQNWEGLLFPDTYEFSEDATASEILQRLADTLELRVNAIDWSVADSLGKSRYESIIMASIIEGETRVDADRPQVASVIINRLELGMPLQIDATILYAMDARGIGLTLADLEIDSVYNSYANLGLPPTPIGAPGKASLEAAASPPQTDFIYYVLTSADGSHSFTADYSQFLTWKDQAKSEGLFP